MQRNIFLVLLISSVMFSSCEVLDKVTSGLSDGDIVQGLKTALEVGADSSVFKTHKTNGFYNDALIKIAFPQEAGIVLQYKNMVPGLSSLVDDFVLSMNRAAEDAASEATPIFKNAITSLSISDGLDILNGINPASSTKATSSFDSTAATQYLRSTTYNDLKSAFAPKIGISLDKKLVGNVSTSSIWSTLTSTYNTAAYFAGWQEVNTDLGGYVTEQALNGMFIKVGQEEIKIRRDPWQWASTAVGDILTKVFGGQ
jgi:hypothetical protein